ncbi:hypothetical protein [Nostoc sp. 'Peltigera membranacea cyanobiont' 232]|uniref:hypothetical protein n=1 Tax=Nostoc sp. 'Peltigera membranacea cyanobiont' 232 TaxID=2014531 RepID=UPI000B95BEDF|nr:hypothetical protein [Nostoc sp. 'Peltigera membranacea cyanobiont' 232]OYE04065.1 hypothetical protein CDG79_15025 [Nostoc sp. 'Peltigera membranacea cyanobiont' 232]
MEPISLIIAALGAGAIAATKDTAGTAVKDAYQGLKTLIKKKFESEPKAQMVLEEHETDPETYEAALKKKLAEAGVDRDAEIIKAAQELLKQEKPEESAAGKYNTVFQGEVKGIQVGDRNKQENKFG